MNTHRRRLLIIDDDAPVRQSLVAYLEDSGFEVLEAADGEAALRRFAETPVELVITDLRMPGIDGLELLRRFKEQQPNLPVIVISGAGVIADVVAALRLGASDYLIKPIADMAVLDHAIERALERQDLRAENQRYREELEATNQALREKLDLLKQDQQAGRQIQKKLLPPSPRHYGDYEITHRVIPSLYLSGDFVDYCRALKRYLLFYLADVSGHGASSAFITVLLKHMVLRLINDYGLLDGEAAFAHAPAKMLEHLNREMFNLGLDKHLTLFVGAVDTKTDRLCYSVAGHLPMPIVASEGQAQFLEGKGKPVGLFEQSEWDVYETRLAERSQLVVFSDGILEIMPQATMADKEAQLLTVMGQAPVTMASLCDTLGISEGLDAPDDIAVLLLNRGY